MTDQTTTRADRRAEWQRLLSLWPYLRQHRLRVGAAVAFLVGAKGATVLLPIALKHIVDSLDPSEHSAAIVLPLGLLLAYGGLRLASVLFGQLRDLVFGRVTERTMHQIALTLFRHLHALDLNFHLSRRTGGLSRDTERGLGGRYADMWALQNQDTLLATTPTAQPVDEFDSRI